jgi:hypothetical protein
VTAHFAKQSGVSEIITLTKRAQHIEAKPRQAGAKTLCPSDATPQMVSAGVEALKAWGDWYLEDELVVAIYNAMEAARLEQSK